MRGTDCLVNGGATNKLRLKVLLHILKLGKSYVLHDCIRLCLSSCVLLFLIGIRVISGHIVFLCFSCFSSGYHVVCSDHSTFRGGVTLVSIHTVKSVSLSIVFSPAVGSYQVFQSSTTRSRTWTHQR